MDIKKMNFDGVEYICIEKEEYEEMIAFINFIERKNNGTLKTINFDTFIKERELKYGL
ncbi:MAG: hypothetical protein HFF36_02505 [Coprobacillus sp.]|nr:hypothetical protein [Coprobacillus sp.]